MWLVANCKNDISSCEAARDLQVTQRLLDRKTGKVRSSQRGAKGNRSVA
jgi:hypothetical protein